jgi:hypothetical protein
MSILEKREVPAEVLPDGTGPPLEDIASASRQGCGLVALMKSPKRTRRSFFALARAILQCVPLPVLLLGDGPRASASHMETPGPLRMRI